MAAGQDPVYTAPPGSAAGFGAVVFAASMMVLIGAFQANVPRSSRPG